MKSGGKQSGTLKILLTVAAMAMISGFQYMSGHNEADGMKDYYRSFTDSATAVVTRVNEAGKNTAKNRNYKVRFYTKDRMLVESGFTDNISEPVEVGNTIAILYDPARPACCDSKLQVRHRTNWMHYTMLGFVVN
jgi:hypothetical protein